VEPKRDRAATAGIVIFVVLTFLGSWFVAATLRVFGLNVQPGPLGTRLFATSLPAAPAEPAPAAMATPQVLIVVALERPARPRDKRTLN
jgi:hypothetical protein